MKLNMLFESDDELQRLIRAYHADPGNTNALMRALSAMGRTHKTSQWKESGITKKAKHLNKHFPKRNWGGPNRNNWLPLAQLSIHWDGKLTRDHAVSIALAKIASEYNSIGEWHIFREGDDWAVLEVEVSEDFIDQLIDEDFIRLDVYVKDGHVSISADWGPLELQV